MTGEGELTEVVHEGREEEGKEWGEEGSVVGWKETRGSQEGLLQRSQKVMSGGSLGLI